MPRTLSARRATGHSLLFTRSVLAMFCLSIATASSVAQDLQPFVGSWAFKLPDGNPAWLQVQDDATGSLLWSVGSIGPCVT